MWSFKATRDGLRAYKRDSTLGWVRLECLGYFEREGFVFAYLFTPGYEYSLLYEIASGYVIECPLDMEAEAVKEWLFCRPHEKYVFYSEKDLCENDLYGGA